MDEKGKYVLWLGAGALLGSAATLATSKLLIIVEGNVLMWTSLTPMWKELVDKDRAKQLQSQEYNSDTFTLSNVGMFGVDHFDAILPPGTGALWLLERANRLLLELRMVELDWKLGCRSSCDMAAFLQIVAKIIEDPKDLTL